MGQANRDFKVNKKKPSSLKIQTGDDGDDDNSSYVVDDFDHKDHDDHHN